MAAAEQLATQTASYCHVLATCVGKWWLEQEETDVKNSVFNAPAPGHVLSNNYIQKMDLMAMMKMLMKDER